MRRLPTHAYRGQPEIPALSPRARRVVFALGTVLVVLLIGFTFLLLPALGP